MVARPPHPSVFYDGIDYKGIPYRFLNAPAVKHSWLARRAQALRAIPKS